MELLEKRFTPSEIIEITDVTKYNLQSYSVRGHLVSDSANIGGGKVQGKRRTYSFCSLMHLAIAKELIDVGFAAKSAFNHAAQFAYTGSSDEEDNFDREPGLPFHQDHGDTLLAVSGNRIWIGCWRHSSPNSMDNMMSALGGSAGYTGVTVLALVNASNVFDRVCRRMDQQAYDILDEVYSHRDAVSET